MSLRIQSTLNMMGENMNRQTNFKKIEEADQLIDYLRDSSNRLRNISSKPCVLQHYTSLKSILSIIESGFWYIGNPHNMNDGLEYDHASRKAWNNKFFASFMSEQTESLAMWSMYAQPWEVGVKVSIPSNDFKRWIRETNEIYYADHNTKKIHGDQKIQVTENDIFISSVAYCNTDSKDISEQEETTCGDANNEILERVASNQQLIGYVKNTAWSYEKEVRILIRLPENYNWDGVAIKIPQYIIDSITITKGPRFESDLLTEIKKRIKWSIKTGTSLFFNRLKHIPCDNCRKGKIS